MILKQNTECGTLSDPRLLHQLLEVLTTSGSNLAQSFFIWELLQELPSLIWLIWLVQQVLCTLLNFPRDLVVTLSTWQRKELMSFQLLKMLDIHKSIECSCQCVTLSSLMLPNQIKQESLDLTRPYSLKIEVNS